MSDKRCSEMNKEREKKNETIIYKEQIKIEWPDYVRM